MAANATSTAAKAPVVSKAAIAPLVQSHWNQDAPYNSLCPTVGSTATYTGCVATATAQIMRYHKHPTQGTGSHSYTWDTQTLSRDFTLSTYDWDNMLLDYGSSYTSDQGTAVARLMVDVGYAVDMDYGTSASGAYSSAVATALPTYFGYSAGIREVFRSNYGLTEWMNLLYTELVNDRPVFFAGSSSSGGHAFVLDGYKDGYFHINWGWGGLSDGYFLISALDPNTQGIGGSSSGYNSNQEAIIGIQPSTGDEEPVATVPRISMESFTATSATVSRNAKFSFYNQASYVSNKSNTSATILVGLKVVDEKGTVAYLSSTKEQTISAGYGSKSTNMDVPLKDFPTDQTQTYKVYPAFKNVADGQWYDIVISTLDTNEYLLATTDDSNIHFTTPAVTAPTLAASHIELPTKVFAGKSFTVKATISATGGEYNDKVYAYTDNSQLGSASVNVDDNISAAIGISCTAPSSTGTYSLTLKDKDGNLLADNLSYTVESVPAGTLALSINNVEFVSTTPTDMHVKLSLNCTSGYYDGQLIAFIFPNNGDQSLGYLLANLNTWKGESTTVDFQGTFSGTTETQYAIYFYKYIANGKYEMIDDTQRYFTLTETNAKTSEFKNIGDLIDGAYAQHKADGKTVANSDRPSLSNVQVDFDADTNPATVVAVLQHQDTNEGKKSDVQAGYVFVVDQSQRGLMLMPSSNDKQTYDLTSLKVGDKITGKLAGNYKEKSGIPAFEVRKSTDSYSSAITTDTSGEATDTEEATYPVTEISNIHFLAKTNGQDADGNTNVGDVTKQAYGHYLNTIITVSGTIREKKGNYFLLQNETDEVDDADLTRIYFTADEFPDINLADYVGTTGTFEGLLIKRNITEAKLSAMKLNFFNIDKLYISEQDNETRISDLVSNGSLNDAVDTYVHRTKLVAATDGYATICLPFDLSADEFKTAFGCDIDLLAEATQTVSNDGVQQFQSVTSKAIEAGKPYLLKATGTQTLANGSATTDGNYWTHVGTKRITGTPTTVKATYSDNIVNGEFHFCGTYGKKQYTTGTDGQPTTALIADNGSQKYQYISTTDGTLRYLPATSTLAFNGLRAYYYFPNWDAAANNAAQPNATKGVVRIVVDGQVVNSIDGLTLDSGDATPIYNLNGQAVGNRRDTLPKGIYVQNGKKFVVE